MVDPTPGSPETARTATLDRRTWVRRSCHVEASARATDLREVHWCATLIDISPGGVRLSVNRRFEVGALLEIELPLGIQLADPVAARVVHVRSGEGGEWIIGCAFAEPLTSAHLQAILKDSSPN